jgi:hypothetical protein
VVLPTEVTLTPRRMNPAVLSSRFRSIKAGLTVRGLTTHDCSILLVKHWLKECRHIADGGSRFGHGDIRFRITCTLPSTHPRIKDCNQRRVHIQPLAWGSLKYDTLTWIAATVTGIFGAAGFGDGRRRCVEWASGGPLDVMIEPSGLDQACEFLRVRLRIRFRWSAARLRTTRPASGDAVVTAPIESFSGSWPGRPTAILSRPSPDLRDEIGADPELPSTTRTVSPRSENDARIEPSIQESPSAWPLAHGHRCERRGECSAQAHQRPSPARRPCASADTTPPADTRRNSDCGAAPAPRRSGSRDFRTATRDRQGSGKRFGRRRR